MLESNVRVIDQCKEELMRTLLTDWTELIERTALIVHLSDKGSVQEAINEFIQEYGPVEKTFSATCSRPVLLLACSCVKLKTRQT